MVDLTKQEFKEGLKELGLRYSDFCELHALSRRTLYGWSSPPDWACWWLRMRLAEAKLNRVRAILDD